MKKSLIIYTLLLCVIIMPFKANSQIAITDISKLSEFKNGTTYVLMDEVDSDRAKEYIAIFNEYWNFSKIEIIPTSSFNNYRSPTNTFINLTTSQTTKRGSSYTQIYFYFQLWNLNEGFLKNPKKDISPKDINQIARVEVFTDEKLYKFGTEIFSTEYDSAKHLRNWGPGVLKNNIQALMTLLDKNEEKSLYSKIRNEEKIKTLKTDTLFVIDYLLIKRNKFNGDESKKFKEKDIFKEYKANYKIITIEELNNKILNDEEFYYLSYIRSSASKFVSIINSKTGECIYLAYNPMSYNFNYKDLRAIQEIIDK